MTRFIQIHFLTGYSAALLNRDDTGLAKRINFGGKIRTRISSQCQKRAWRMHDGDDAIRHVADMADDVRTKKIIEQITEDIVAEYGYVEDAVNEVAGVFILAVYGDKAKELKSRQGLLFSAREITFLRDQMVACMNSDDPKAAADAFKRDYKAIAKQMREQGQIQNGVTASLFGRMVTSDVEANTDAAIHVAHAFTVHADKSESDFFSAVDDLAGDEETGAGHIGDTEIASGLFYGYVVVDVPLLISNLGGDREMAGDIVRRLVRQIASVSPGAKRGSTAPYGYASTLLVEGGNAQPRSLAEAFRNAVTPETHAAAEDALAAHLAHIDQVYATGEDRAWLSLRNDASLLGERLDLRGVSEFAASKVRED